MIIERSKQQHYGLGLLWTHLQRLFVYYRTNELLAKTTEEVRLSELKRLLDGVSIQSNSFKMENGLSEEAVGELLKDMDSVKALTIDYISKIDDHDLNNALAVASSEIYAEEHLNNSNIVWGKLFDPELEDRLLQRIGFYKKCVGDISYMVQKKMKTIPLDNFEEQYVKRVQQHVVGQKEDLEVRLQFFELMIIGKENQKQDNQ